MLKELHPEEEYYFIVGSDSIVSFMSWYRPDVILKYATLLAVRRDDESSLLMDEKIREINEKFETSVGMINMKSMAVSSSYIRVCERSLIKDMVPEVVYEYIIENDLYADDNVNVAWSINKITEDLKIVLKPQRFEHTLGVANTAKEMAETFGVNPNKAYFAGMLHDCAKNLSDEQLLQICAENNIEISEYEAKSPYLLHGKVGAHIARTKYGISDEEILSAIVWHTTGKPNMTDLEKIVFSADYIEPGRHKQPNLDFLRELAQKDLDLLTFNILKDTVEYLKENKSDSIDDNTISAYEFYKKLMEER